MKNFNSPSSQFLLLLILSSLFLPSISQIQAQAIPTDSTSSIKSEYQKELNASSSITSTLPTTNYNLQPSPTTWYQKGYAGGFTASVITSFFSPKTLLKGVTLARLAEDAQVLTVTANLLTKFSGDANKINEALRSIGLTEDLIKIHVDEIIALSKAKDEAGVAKRLAKIAEETVVATKAAKAGKYLDEAVDAATLIGKTNIETIVADTAKIVVKDPELAGGANMVKGTAETARNIVDGMTIGWSKIKDENIGGKILKTFASPDNKWKINIRTLSSSAQKVADAGYKLEMTMDVMPLNSIGDPIKNASKEIKFITKALQ